MKLTGKGLSQRLHETRLTFFKQIDKHKKMQEKIDFVIDNDWLKKQDKAVVSFYISTLFSFELSISISNISTDEFIENILGPYHLEYNINWEMEVIGDKDDPTIVFKEFNRFTSNHPTFNIKEGEFKVCEFISKIVGFHKPREAEPIYKTEMICV